MIQNFIILFWQDAVSPSKYKYNRLPHKGINNKIPYEVLFNKKKKKKKKVDFNTLKDFGCQVFYYVPKQFTIWLDP